MRILAFIIALLVGSQSFAGTKRWIPRAAGTSDDFNRADGGLGANWANNGTDVLADGATDGTTFKIASNAAVPTANDKHAFAVWTNGVFTADQYSQVSLVNVGISSGWNGCAVRTVLAVDKFFFAFVFTANDYGFDVRTPGTYPSYPPALGSYTSQTWASGDKFALEVRDSDPARLYMFRNAALVASTVATDYAITSGNPGIGTYNPSGSSLGVDSWIGGNASLLTADSGATSDNFTRANADTLGTDWVNGAIYNGNARATGFKIASNKAVPLAAGGTETHWAFRVKDMTTNHSCSVVIGTQGASDWQGPIAGADFKAYYIVIVVGSLPSSSGFLYEYDGTGTSGGFHLISSITATWASGDACELDDTASGTPNRTLVVKQNGTTRLTTTDSTYKLKGTHGGLGAANANGVTITSWSAASL